MSPISSTLISSLLFFAFPASSALHLSLGPRQSLIAICDEGHEFCESSPPAKQSCEPGSICTLTGFCPPGATCPSKVSPPCTIQGGQMTGQPGQECLPCSGDTFACLLSMICSRDADGNPLCVSSNTSDIFTNTPAASSTAGAPNTRTETPSSPARTTAFVPSTPAGTGGPSGGGVGTGASGFQSGTPSLNSSARSTSSTSPGGVVLLAVFVSFLSFSG